MVLDMLANGDWQAQRGDYDEAALPCYRAVQLAVARRLKFQHETDNSAVKEADVPSPSRAPEGRARRGSGARLPNLKKAGRT